MAAVQNCLHIIGGGVGWVGWVDKITHPASEISFNLFGTIPLVYRSRGALLVSEMNHPLTVFVL